MVKKHAAIYATMIVKIDEMNEDRNLKIQKSRKRTNDTDYVITQMMLMMGYKETQLKNICWFIEPWGIYNCH